MHLLKAFALLALFSVSPVTVSGQKATEGSTSKVGQETEMSLKEQLEAKVAESAAKFPPEMLNKFKSAVEDIKASGLEETAKKVGDQAVDATLPDWNGNSVTLSDQWANGPVVLMWYRGGW